MGHVPKKRRSTSVIIIVGIRRVNEIVTSQKKSNLLMLQSGLHLTS